MCTASSHAKKNCRRPFQSIKCKCLRLKRGAGQAESMTITGSTTLNNTLVCIWSAQINCYYANLALQIFEARKTKAKNKKAFTRQITRTGWDQNWQNHVRCYKMEGRWTTSESQAIFNGERYHESWLSVWFRVAQNFENSPTACLSSFDTGLRQ